MLGMKGIGIPDNCWSWYRNVCTTCQCSAIAFVYLKIPLWKDCLSARSLNYTAVVDILVLSSSIRSAFKLGTSPL